MYRVYLLHFQHHLHHAHHYVGVSSQLANRIHAHANGHREAGRLPQVFHDLGITFVVARVWDIGHDRTAAFAFETRIKRQAHTPRLCPICNPSAFNNMCDYPSRTPTKGELFP
jgi:predicted GIY-YIG superfamily endonuclease